MKRKSISPTYRSICDRFPLHFTSGRRYASRRLPSQRGKIEARIAITLESYASFASLREVHYTSNALAKEPASRYVARKRPPEDNSGAHFPILPRSCRTIGARPVAISPRFDRSIFHRKVRALHPVLAREFRAKCAKAKFRTRALSRLRRLPSLPRGTGSSWLFSQPFYSPGTCS